MNYINSNIAGMKTIRAYEGYKPESINKKDNVGFLSHIWEGVGSK